MSVMSTTRALLFCMVASLWLSVPVEAHRGDLSSIIESFMAKQFPDAKSHFWVVNGTQWQTDNEVVVDVNTVVLNQSGQTPSEDRYLLLVVGNSLAAAQRIPMDAGAECHPEQT